MNVKEKLFGCFLTTYYLTVSLGGSLIEADTKEEIYYSLAKAYLIKDKEKLDGFFHLSLEDPYLEMDTLAEYERTCRMLEYARARGFDNELTAEDKIILSAKRAALTVAKELLPSVENVTADILRDALLRGISDGNIHAMTILAYLDKCGIAIGQNIRRAEINIDRAAKWNSLDANLIEGYLFPKKRDVCLSRIAASDKSSYGEDLCRYIAEEYGISEVSVDENAALLERAFCIGAVPREKYDIKFASIIYSEIITSQDKKRIITSYKKETLGLYYDLPTDVSADLTLSVARAALDGGKLCRQDEARRIKRNLVGITQRGGAKYKPLLFVCRDGYVLSEYKRAMSEVLSSNPIVNIDASHLIPQELSQTKENVFLRSLADTKRVSTVFMIDACHKLSQSMASELSKFLRGDIRAAFRLVTPPVGFDMSGMLPVLFSLGEPDGVISEYCDVIRLAPISADEKIAMIKNTLDGFSEAYGIDGISLSDEVFDILKTKSSDAIEECIDELVKYMACEERPGEIDKETYTVIMSDIRQGTVKFGF